MNIVEPKVEYWQQKDPIDRVAKIAHTCYHSPDRGHDANVKFYKNLLESNHISTLRHLTYYYKLPLHTIHDDLLIDWIHSYDTCPYVEIKEVRNGDWRNTYYIVTNGQFLYEDEFFAEEVKLYQVSEEVFIKEQPDMRRFTFCLLPKFLLLENLIELLWLLWKHLQDILNLVAK